MDTLLMFVGLAIGMLAHMARIEWMRNGWARVDPYTDEALVAARLAYYAPPFRS